VSSFETVANPDGWKPLAQGALDGIPADVRARHALDERLFLLAGRRWYAARGLDPAEVEAALEVVGADVGLHLSHFGRPPGKDVWLAWEGLSKIKHLSFNGAFLGAKGWEAFHATHRLGALQTLDLSVCDIGLKGLKLLKTSNEMPALEELYLGANTDYDRTQKAVAALLSETKKEPIGASLRGLEVLGLLFWQLCEAMPALEQSAIVQGLRRLWITDRYYADHRHQSNVAALPASLQAKCVVGWEQTPISMVAR